MRSQDGRGQDNGLPSVPGLPARRSWHGAGTKREATRLKGSGGKSREGGVPRHTAVGCGGFWVGRSMKIPEPPGLAHTLWCFLTRLPGEDTPG